jgi:BON domain-containing protein
MMERERNDIEKELGDPEAELAEDETAGNPTLEGDRVNEGEVEPDFSGVESGSGVIEAVENGDVYSPPMDPVIGTGRHGEAEVIGGTGESALDPGVGPALSAEDNQPGDEALVDAIRECLRLDAATSAIEPSVQVDVREGIAYLAGSVDGPEDVDTVEAVVAAVPGVVDVVEQLTVSGL